MKKRLHTLFLLSTLLVIQVAAQTANFALVGFATENGGTTGGKGGIEKTVSTYADLKKFAEEKDTKYIIKVSGTIQNGADGGSIRIASNKTIIGTGANTLLNGVGFTISGVKNIIIQNLRMTMMGVTTRTDKSGVYSSTGDEGRPQILTNAGDCICVQGVSTNIWIDHCEFYAEDPKKQTNQDLYDGLVDVKNQSGYITISWCYFHDHHKCHLIGSSDKDLFADRKITFHHNYYKNIQERVPLYRGGVGHVFNNYMLGVYAGSVNTRMEACIRVEKNYFESSKNNVYSKNSTLKGSAELIDNKEVNCTSTEDIPSSCKAAIPYTYASVLTSNTNDVKALVVENAGVGKIGTVVTDLEEMDSYSTSATWSSYPNPCKDFAIQKLLLPSTANVQISLFDAYGRQVVQQQLVTLGAGEHEWKLDTRALTAGIYVQVLSINGKNTSSRLIIGE